MSMGETGGGGRTVMDFPSFVVQRVPPTPAVRTTTTESPSEILRESTPIDWSTASFRPMVTWKGFTNTDINQYDTPVGLKDLF